MRRKGGKKESGRVGEGGRVNVRERRASVCFPCACAWSQRCKFTGLGSSGVKRCNGNQNFCKRATSGFDYASTEQLNFFVFYIYGYTLRVILLQIAKEHPTARRDGRTDCANGTVETLQITKIGEVYLKEGMENSCEGKNFTKARFSSSVFCFNSSFC